MLSDDELASIRDTVEEWLPDTCTITRPDGGQTSAGRADGTPSTVASNVPCRVEPDNDRRREVEHQSGVFANPQWRITMPHDTPAVKPQDTIVVTNLGTFKVQAATSGRSIAADVVVNCVKVS